MKILIDTSLLQSNHTYNYYIHDNQGSVRAVVDENGTLVQATDYSAYGVPSSRFVSTTSDKHLHLGLEWQPMKGIYGYYNNARFRDAILAGTFYQQDPLAEKYYPFTPYHYAAGNPIRYKDADGLKVDFPGATNEFKNNYNTAYTYLKENGCSEQIDKLIESQETTYHIVEGKESKFIPNTRTIMWAPTKGILTDENAYLLSPAEILSHESDHANQNENATEIQTKDKGTTDSVYGNKEEKRVITGSEQEVAKKLGKLKEGETTRKNHFGTYLDVSSPTARDLDDITGGVEISN
ncbi:MAG: hypothetical protein PHR45_04195 [Muribaculaceae bacterium]|nr:hypothetical protein [Muribaculaceae bacterium]